MMSAPRGGEVGNEPLRLDNHQVYVQWQGRVRTNGGDHGGPDGEVRHEPSVHDIDVDGVGAGGGRLAHDLAQAGEVGGEDRRSELRRAHGPTRSACTRAASRRSASSSAAATRAGAVPPATSRAAALASAVTS